MAWTTLTSWKRQADMFHLTLGYGEEEHFPNLELLMNGQPLKQDVVADTLSSCKFHIQLDWAAGDDEDQVVLKLQSQLMVTLPAPHDEVQLQLHVTPPGNKETSDGNHLEEEEKVNVFMEVHKQRELLKIVSLTRTVGSAPSGEGLGVLTRVLDPGSAEHLGKTTVSEELLGYTQHYRFLSVLNLSNCFLTVSPPNPSVCFLCETSCIANQLYCVRQEWTIFTSQIRFWSLLTTLAISRAT